MVEVQIQQMYSSDRNRPKDYRRAVVINAEQDKTTEDTLGSKRGVFSKNL
jgi:hypothetical protein